MVDILFVSIAFPPKNDPECLQTAKYFKYMAAQEGVTIDVVTSAIPTLFMPKDDKLLPYAEGARQQIDISYFENKYVNFAIRKLSKAFLEKPDSKYGFIKGASKAHTKLKHKPQCVYSRSFPISSAIAAYHLVQHYKVPWVLHLSDPWADSPIHEYTTSGMKFHQEWERKCIGLATHVCFTSNQAVNFYKKKYPQYDGKFIFSPNVYDPKDISTAPHVFGEKLKLVYTGGLIEDRSPDKLLAVLEELYKNDPSIADKIELIFAGALDRRNRAVFDQCKLPFVQHLGLLSFPDAVKLQRTANVLMLIDTPFKREEEALYFPSKLLDYIAAKRRIFAITNKNSPTTDVVDGKYGDWCLHRDLDKIEKIILDAIDHFEKKDNNNFCNESADPKFSADYNAKRLVQLIKDII